MQTGSFSLQAAAGCTCRPSTFFFLTPVTGNPRDDRPSYLSICGIGDEGDSSKFPSSPSRAPCGTANEILQRRTAERTRVPRVSATSRVRVSRKRCAGGARGYVCVRTCVLCVCVSPPPKRIRGKRARRWINTKTSVTHDQARPSSTSVSSSASPYTHRQSRFVRDGIGVALVLQDVHLDQYHWKLSKQIIDRAKKTQRPRTDRPTNRTNRTRRYITHGGGEGMAG